MLQIRPCQPSSWTTQPSHRPSVKTVANCTAMAASLIALSCAWHASKASTPKEQAC